ncbi:ATP-dependent DNA helicase PcrA [Poriferisphaera corsica]|uniref:DNA 3'-5' helicase n=1 Tax=Poriferisphaera corsica TaxID=2528020 RepID=A0A517YSU5_9BACT|nr:UvrD-helicase domain-containing protein [Poriferisphaera corsica]QDU33307.1 ATP-dependent DNA helicase PcrA [Poriferisphaera corsica]
MSNDAFDAPLTDEPYEIPSGKRNLLEGLTEPQVQAVTTTEGALLVLAGPGSGKTRVITSRIAYLMLECGIPPWNILAITFTNKAAGEMRERVSQVVSQRQSDAATISTFHSLCARIIRIYSDKIGLPASYSIYDSSDQQRAVKRALEELEINTKNFPPASVLSAISNAKNELQNASAFEAMAGDFYTKKIAQIYKKYESILNQSHALDFDDLLMKTVQLFREHPIVLAELQERYQYIMIDEYQDTNHAQFMIANALAARHKNICATGDPDQSIYGWRGANIQNILDFESHYPDAQTVRLEQNYRSTKTILAAADALIQSNTARKHKELWTDNEQGHLIECLTCRDSRHEARQIVQEFEKLNSDERIPWGSMAVFYRMNSLSRVMEDAFRDSGIPYQIARGTAFYDRKEIKDAIAYLRTIVNPADEINLLRIINTPARGISDKTVKTAQAQAVASNRSVIEVLSQPEQIPGLNTRAINSVNKFLDQLREWRRLIGLNETATLAAGYMSLPDFVEQVLEGSGLATFYKNDKSDPDRERLANLSELVNSAQQFTEDFLEEFIIDDEAADDAPASQQLLGFLERIALVSDVDAIESDQGSVTLMTLHAAKGLEFNAVAMIGVEDGLLPHERSQNDDNELEEERRLCFVGITRAMKRLILSNARYRTVFGQTMPTMKSRFFKELPEELCEQIDLSDGGFGDTSSDSSSSWGQTSSSARDSKYQVGMLVRHPKFGLGRIQQVSSSGGHTKASVAFNQYGVKPLILEYAKLEIVDMNDDLPF